MTIDRSSKVLHSAPSLRRGRRAARGGRVAVAVLALMLVGGLLAYGPGQAGAQGHFSDTADHWGHDGINFLMDAGILGDPNSTWCGPSEFCPGDATQRWVSAVWLVRALSAGQDPAPISESSFSDISPDDPWAPHIEFLAEYGLSVGYPDGTFRPHAPVTRRHMSVFMERGLKIELLVANAAILRHGGLVVLHTCSDASNDCPHEPVSRGESAAMLAAGLQGKLDQRPTDAPEGIFWRIAPGISAGDYHTCALYHSGPKDDEVACWGLNPHGQLDNPNPPHWKYKVVAAGGGHTCVIRRDNQLDCWGLNNHGQTDVPEGRYKNVAAGAANTCAIRTDNHLDCWGKRDNGIVFDVPEHAMDNLDVGANHACSIRRGSTTDPDRKRLYCWGDDAHGAVSNAPVHYPNSLSHSFDSSWFQHEGRHFFGVAAGSAFTCAAIYEAAEGWDAPESWGRIETQYRQCWGLNDRNQAPRRPDPPEFPTVMAGDTQIIEHMIGVGWWHGCALRSEDNTAFCWGDDTYGQLAHGDGAAYRALAVGATHACGVKFDQSIGCWGFAL